MGVLTSNSGRRGNWLYRYGLHGWVPYQQTDFSRGMIRDLAKTDIPENGLYDCVDFLAHREGHLIKRGPTAYAGPAMGSATFAQAVMFAEFESGTQLLGMSDLGDSSGHLYTVTAGTTTNKGGTTGHNFKSVDNPKMFYGPGLELVIFAQEGTGGDQVPAYYDGSAAPAPLPGVSADGKYCEVYKGRVVLGGGINAGSGGNRVFFSPLLDPRDDWDFDNAWIDFAHPITGLASLQNALLVFSAGHTERLIGSTPPSATDSGDMDRQPVGDIGCIDARSIAIYQNQAVVANARGVYLCNGIGFESLTGGIHGNDGIETLWQSTLGSFTPGTDIVAGGVIRDFYVVCVTISGDSTTFMCHIPTRSWVQLSNISATMFASAQTTQDELYYADATAPRIVKLSGMFIDENTVDQAGTDANGISIRPVLETKSFGGGIGDIAWGDAHLTFGFEDTDPTSSPTLLVTYRPYAYTSEGSTLNSKAFSPSATFSLTRRRYTIGADARAMSIHVEQTDASGATVIRAIEIDQRGYPQPIESTGQ